MRRRYSRFSSTNSLSNGSERQVLKIAVPEPVFPPDSQRIFPQRGKGTERRSYGAVREPTACLSFHFSYTAWGKMLKPLCVVIHDPKMLHAGWESPSPSNDNTAKRVRKEDIQGTAGKSELTRNARHAVSPVARNIVRADAADHFKAEKL